MTLARATSNVCSASYAPSDEPASAHPSHVMHMHGVPGLSRGRGRRRGRTRRSSITRITCTPRACAKGRSASATAVAGSSAPPTASSACGGAGGGARTSFGGCASACPRTGLGGGMASSDAGPGDPLPGAQTWSNKRSGPLDQVLGTAGVDMADDSMSIDPDPGRWGSVNVVLLARACVVSVNDTSIQPRTQSQQSCGHTFCARPSYLRRAHRLTFIPDSRR